MKNRITLYVPWVNMTLLSRTVKPTDNGYKTVINKYQAQNYKGCHMRGLCHKSQANRIIQVSHELKEYRKKAKELLMSDQGLYHRSKRPIEPEAVFGQMKQNIMYKRFRHFRKDKVLMDITIFAIAFNLAKLFSKQFFMSFLQFNRLYRAILSQNNSYKIKTQKKQNEIYIYRKNYLIRAA